jgi:hypothetical protein
MVRCAIWRCAVTAGRFIVQAIERRFVESAAGEPAHVCLVNVDRHGQHGQNYYSARHAIQSRLKTTPQAFYRGSWTSVFDKKQLMILKSSSYNKCGIAGILAI